MKSLALLTGLLIVILGFVGVVAPGVLVTIGLRSVTPAGLYVVAALRIIIGLVLLGLAAVPNNALQRTRSAPLRSPLSPETLSPESVLAERRFRVAKLLNRLLALVAVAMLSASIGCASAGSPKDVQSQILRIDAEWSGAAQGRDVDRVVAFWADDAIVFPPGSPPLEGKPAIREFVAKSFQTPGFSISWKTTNIAVSRSGDFAYATGTNRVGLTGPDGRQVTVEGKAVTVWRREKEGIWKCVIDIWND